MKKILSLVLAACLCFYLFGCDGNSNPTETTTTGPAKDVNYEISIRTIGGQIPLGIKVQVFKDASKATGLVYYTTLTNSGVVKFTAPESDTYTLVLEGVAEGYQVQDYTLTDAKMDIVLNSAVVPNANPVEVQYVVGDIMRDFSFTDVDGKTYTVSGLLETKKAVVLNFWNIKCDPCKAEFPNVQNAYAAYSDKLELLAMNPVKGDTEEGIRDFREKFELTMPIGICDSGWSKSIAPGNPTTVIIDRYGCVVFVHTGAITEAGVLEALFEYVTAEDYQQQMIRDMDKFLEENVKG